MPENPTLAQKLNKVPKFPGVYLWKNDKGVVIYVGKAKVLTNRVRSYFQQIWNKDIKTRLLVSNIVDLEWIVTDTEKEALILENTLIKKYRPRYNVRLLDDKNYPCLRLSKETFPRLTVVRKIKRDAADYYGPFSSSSAVKISLRVLNRHFPLRKCNDIKFKHRSRPCIMHQIGQCEAPCVAKITPEDYDKIVRQVKLFFEGKSELLTTGLNAEMERCSNNLEFERAAKYRDTIIAIRQTLERQKTVASDFVSRDFFDIYREGGAAVVSMLYLRNGAIFGHRAFPLTNMELPDEEILTSVIKQYYGADNLVPGEVVVPLDLGEEVGLIETWLSEMEERKVRVIRAVRGRKREILDMAAQNARSQFETRRAQIINTANVLAKIQKRFALGALPTHIECFDISNMQGTHQVASQVTFIEGEPDKRSYRHYKIKTLDDQDDYGAMREVLTRRFSKSREEMPYPDLLLIDGGKGQLNIALAVLDELGIHNLNVAAFTKIRTREENQPEDMAYLPGRKNPVRFTRGGDDLFLLQRVRDESHRFAIEFHRKLRDKKMRESVLDHVPGIGAARKKALLKHFGSVKRIAAATPEELSKASGISIDLGKTILDYLKEKPNGG